MVLTLLNPIECVWEANTYGFALIKWSVVSDHCTDWHWISTVSVTENFKYNGTIYSVSEQWKKSWWSKQIIIKCYLEPYAFESADSDECVYMLGSFPFIKRSLNIPDSSVLVVNAISPLQKHENNVFLVIKISEILQQKLQTINLKLWSRIFLKLCWKCFCSGKTKTKNKENWKLLQVHLNMYIYNLMGKVQGHVLKCFKVSLKKLLWFITITTWH